MSGSSPEDSSLEDSSPNSPRRYRTATEIIRSILDDRPPTASISPSGELYRAIERFHRSIDPVRERRQELRTVRGGSSMSHGSENLRRRFNRDPPSGAAAADIDTPSSNTSLPPLRSRNLQRASRTAPRGGRHTAAESRTSSRGLGGAFGTPARERLADENNHLRSLLNVPLPPPRAMSPPAPPAAPSEPSEENRRVKRRRLDSDKIALGKYRGFRYGRYGQAEPGPLTMELMSCDGGSFMDGYAAENILKNDSSVYCTKGNRCNIVLRHQGSTVFSVKQLIIKAPDSNFTSPVREGMVFIAMESDELFRRTAQYQIQYSAPTPRERLEVHSLRYDDNGTHLTRLPPLWATSREANIGMDGDDEDPMDTDRLAQLPAEFVSPDVPFTITTECTNADGEVNQAGEPFRRTTTQQVPQIGALPFESDASEDDSDTSASALAEPEAPDTTSTGGPPPRGQWASRGGRYFATRLSVAALARRRALYVREASSAPSRSLSEAREASQLATQEAVRAVGGELMTPMVHFHIEKNNSNCIINFDPPINGRYLLLKMWSPHHDPTANIDIQGVIVKGFAGPRFHAAVEYR